MPEKIWMFDRTFEPRYDAAMVCALTSVSSDNLQNWAKRELIFPEGGGGKGVRRLYTKYDLIEIAIARDLMRVGVEAGVAFWFAGNVLGSTYNHLKNYKGPWSNDFEKLLSCATCFIIPPELGKPRTETQFKVIDSADIADEDLRENILNPNHAVIQIAGGDIIIDLELDENELYGEDFPAPKAAKPTNRRTTKKGASA